MMACKAKLFYKKHHGEETKQEETKNIVKFLYSILAENKPSNQGPPSLCRGCGASICLYSQLLTREDYYKKLNIEAESEQVSDEKKAEQDKKDETTDFLKGKYLKGLSVEELAWICEFCGVHNRLLKNVVRPQSEDELYLIKKVPEVTKKTDGVEETKIEEEVPDLVNSNDESSLIFCIDVSGSMGENHKVETNGKKTSISRIKLIQDAVLKQLEEMRKTHPNRIVGVVSFEDYVRIYGDNVSPVKVNKDNNNYDDLLNNAREMSNAILTRPLQTAYDQVTTAVKSLMPLSCTALGPGLLCSLGLLQGRRGSRVILCTDGLANVGLGSLGGSGEISGPSRQFYDRVGDLAVECGLSISIITVEGNACRVDALGPLTDRTGGTIIRVNPANVDLSEITSNSLIATDVVLKVIMHEGLAFEHQDSSHLHNNGSILIKQVGSVSVNNEAYFEYRVKEVQELEKAGVNLEEIKSIPMQSQITYKDMKGNEFVRVITRQQELTEDRKEAKKGVRANILSGYVQTESANLVLQGRTKEAKGKKEGWANYMNECLEEECVQDNVDVWNEFQAQNVELDDLIEQTEIHKASRDVAKKDDIASKLYKIKQTKKK